MRLRSVRPSVHSGSSTKRVHSFTGADDITREDDTWHVVCDAAATHDVRTAVEEAGIAVHSADLTMLPSSTIAIDALDAAKAVLRVIDALDDHDDVQEVYANADIGDDLIAQLD